MTTSEIQEILTIVYASQTGQAKAIAESIYDLILKQNLNAQLFCISKHEKDFKLNELSGPLVFVCSTTGDGEVPETALKCFNKLKRLPTDSNKTYLCNLNYAILGLGDSNYTQFCNGPKSFHKRFQELGANCFYGPFWADDGVGLELVVEEFKENICIKLKEFITKPKINQDSLIDQVKNLKFAESELNLPLLAEKHLLIELKSDANNNNDCVLTDSPENMMKIFSHIYSSATSEIYEASIKKNSVLTNENAEKTCFCLNFALTNYYNRSTNNFDENNVQIEYEPGYSLSFICPNDEQEVHSLLKRLKINPINDKIVISSSNSKLKSGMDYVKLTHENNLSVEFFFKYCVDIRNNAIKKGLLRMLSTYCADKKDEQRLLELCSKEGADQFQSLLKENSLSLLDLLNMFESCEPPVDFLIQMLPFLSTRSYTLSSFPNSQNTMEIIFNLVKFSRSNGRTYERNGIATGYLSKLKENQKIYFFKKKIQNFTFPKDLNTSKRALIMISPGTGIAPMLSFLRLKQEEVKNQNNTFNNIWLFYGCRDINKDFLFKTELCRIQSIVLNKMFVSFSRMNQEEINFEENETNLALKNFYIPNSKYVQDSIKENGKELVDLICNQEAYIYICGDAKNMFKDVFNCLVECISQYHNLNLDESNKYLLEMIKEKRFKQDVWA